MAYKNQEYKKLHYYKVNSSSFSYTNHAIATQAKFYVYHCRKINNVINTSINKQIRGKIFFVDIDPPLLLKRQHRFSPYRYLQIQNNKH